MGTGRRSARELERAAALRAAPSSAPPPDGGEALAMLVRRGLHPRLARRDVPFPPDPDPALADALSERLGHYGFRLFLRGAILARGAFRPEDATRYLSAAQARRMADDLVALGLAAESPDGHVRLRWHAQSFGGTLEWWVGRELARRLRLDVATGVRSGAPGVGGDLDVVAAAEGRLVYVELKSSPPKHVMPEELASFLRRIRALRPSISVLAIDTALRVGDKLLPMLEAAVAAGGRAAPERRRVVRDSWRVAPQLYLVNARYDLVDNVAAAIADGLVALGPPPP